MIHSFNIKGLKENFKNWIGTVTPEQTPFYNSTNHGIATNTIVNSVYDQNDFPDTAETLSGVEGTDQDSYTSNELVRITSNEQKTTNYTQIFRKLIKISSTVINTSVYGRESELTYQIGKAAKSCKNRLEFTVFGSQAGNIGTSTTSARMKGILSLLSDDEHPNFTGVKVKDSTGVSADSIIKMCNIQRKIGNTSNIIYFNPGDAHHLAKAQVTPIKDGSTDAGERRLLQKFNGDNELYTFTDDTGFVWTCISNLFVPIGSMFFINPQEWSIDFLRDFKPTKLDTDGSYQSYLIEGEATLSCLHPWCAGVIYKI